MNNAVTDIVVCEDVTLVTMNTRDPLLVPDVLTALASESINVDMISQSAQSGGSIDLDFTISDRDLARVLVTLGAFSSNERRGSCSIMSGNAKVGFFGEAMKVTPGVAAGIFAMIVEAGITIKLITTSTVDISVLIDMHSLPDLLVVLAKDTDIPVKHEEF